MKKNILITGGLGYIGSELAKIYSGSSWYHEIFVIDQNFYSERVNQLAKWNIKFFQGDILDKNFLNKFVSQADIIHHLAGITNVAYIKSDKDIKRDEEITQVAIAGTNNILELMNEKSKIIFPSTHVVFDGLEKPEKLINEKREKKPILTYSISKSQNEEDIKKSKKNFVILRLGSVYGFSGDATRIQIVPNLFSKIASQNGTIKLFGGGIQTKSLVSINDVARCFKFMEEKTSIKNEIYNVSKENVTVQKIAEECRKINPKLKILKTDDEIPNPGYTLDNNKLKKTGFKFLYSLPQSLKKMINSWKEISKSKNLEYVESGKNNFIDKRGFISNFELTEPINLIGLIASKYGTVRANHFHPIQEQKCLVTKGQFISVYKDLLSDDKKVVTHVVNENEIIVTKPNVAHAMVFSKDTTFLNLVSGEREHNNYGITHTMPYNLVDGKLSKKLLEGYKFNCRVCNNTKLKRVISFGLIPLANNLKNSKKEKSEEFPLELNFCENCLNCQLSYVVDPKILFSNYLYLSSTSKLFQNHFNDACKHYIKKLSLRKKDFIIDIGSNDGIALRPFIANGFSNVLGIEPAKNIARIANKNKIKTLNVFFNKKIINNLKNRKASLILASNVFAHSDKIDEITETINKILEKKGVLIIEIQYLINTLIDKTFDNIYHEHVNYWCLHSLIKYFSKHHMKIFDCNKIDTHGGSLRVFITKNENKIKISSNVKKMLIEEIKLGIKDFKIFENFRMGVEKIKSNVKINIDELSKKYKKIYGFGAPAKATTALNYFGISDKFYEVFEDNNLKHNKFIPGTDLKIIKKNNKNKVDCLVVLAWNFFNDIKKNNSQLAKKIISIKNLERN